MTQVTFPFVAAPAAPVAPLPATGGGALVPPAAPPAPAAGDADPGEAIGFDHARYGLVPPADCLWPGHPVREGWERGRRVLGRRTRPASLAVQRWLALRLRAWRDDEAFDELQLTPSALRALEAATRCPVTGTALDATASVLRLDPARGWTAGNLALVAAPVAMRLDAMSWADACAALAAAERAAEDDAAGVPTARDARSVGGSERRREIRPGPSRFDAGEESIAAAMDDESASNRVAPVELQQALAAAHAPRAFTLAQWRRAVALKSLATVLPAGEAREQPMRVLPPNRVRVVNAIQGLQALLSLQLVVPGWGARSARVAAAIPAVLRCEFHLFFHTLLAATLRAARDAGVTSDEDRAGRRAAVERAWGDAAVRRRWERLAHRVDDALAATLVERLSGEPLPGLQLLRHADGLALGA